MTLDEPLGSAEDKSLELRTRAKYSQTGTRWPAFRQSGGGETSAENLGNLLHQVSKTSMDEIDNLISELQTSRSRGYKNPE